jgi:hypothetical protein
LLWMSAYGLPALKAEPQVHDYMTACELYATGDVRPLCGKLIPGTVESF